MKTQQQSKHLTVLFSHNRPLQLGNAILSLDKYGPVGDVLVLDDNSTDKLTLQLLDYVKTHSRTSTEFTNWRVYTPIKDVSRPMQGVNRHGSFFGNLQLALDYALTYGYETLCTMEDDQQWLWRDDELIESVTEIFNLCSDAIQVSPLFFRRIHTVNVEYIARVGAYRTNRGFQTNGFWNLKAFSKLMMVDDFKVLNEEAPTSGWLLRKGWRVYVNGWPSLAVLDGRVNSYGSSVRPMLPTLSRAKISKLQSHGWLQVPYQEHYTESSLVWHQAGNRNRFRQLCAERLKHVDMVQCFGNWKPSQLEPLKSHLNWAEGELGWRARIKWPDWAVTLRHFSLVDWLAKVELELKLKAEIEQMKGGKK